MNFFQQSAPSVPRIRPLQSKLTKKFSCTSFNVFVYRNVCMWARVYLSNVTEREKQQNNRVICCQSHSVNIQSNTHRPNSWRTKNKNWKNHSEKEEDRERHENRREKNTIFLLRCVFIISANHCFVKRYMNTHSCGFHLQNRRFRALDVRHDDNRKKKHLKSCAHSFFFLYQSEKQQIELNKGSKGKKREIEERNNKKEQRSYSCQ